MVKKMKKFALPFLLLIALSIILGFQWKDRNKKIQYQLVITSLKDTEADFDATFQMGKESIRLIDQKTPYNTTIETSDLEGLVRSTNPIRIILRSRNGKLEADVTSAYIEADGTKKRIMGM
jgi:hypothetical protein